jgi:hypothetical protein
MQIPLQNAADNRARFHKLLGIMPPHFRSGQK